MAKDDPPPQLIPDLHPGKYSDGHPLDDVHYLECKIILKPDRFTSRQGFVEFAKLARRAASSADVGSPPTTWMARGPIREVVFLDTADFRLYNNAFILRRRISYEDGTGGRPGDRLQVPASGHAEGRGDGRAAAHPRHPPDQVQGGDPAPQGQDRRHARALLSQRGVRHEPAEGIGPRGPVGPRAAPRLGGVAAPGLGRRGDRTIVEEVLLDWASSISARG